MDPAAAAPPQAIERPAIVGERTPSRRPHGNPMPRSRTLDDNQRTGRASRPHAPARPAVAAGATRTGVPGPGASARGGSLDG